MPARVLFIGLDAAEPVLIDELSASGRMPAMAGLATRGVTAPLDNCMLTLPGAVWPEIASGVSCGRLPRFFHPRQVITGSAAPRPLTADDVRDDPTFWQAASDAGRKVAVVDIPHTPRASSLRGIQVVEYGLHDSHFGTASLPDALIGELGRAYGPYPVGSCDHRGGSTRANRRLLDDLLLGIARKEALLVDLAGRERWDLFACAFSESHCAGHWFWEYHDPTHWNYRHQVPPELGDALRTVYQRLDQAVAAVVAAAGAETAIVLASHGMAPYVAGYQLLPEVLARLGLSSSAGGTGHRLRRLQHAAKHWVPRRHWERLGRVVVEGPVARGLLRPLQARQGAMFFPLESPATRAVYVPNNTIGAIRINLRGREPFGSVEPGDEAVRLAADIRRELLALAHPETGEPIVSGVVTAVDAFGEGHHPDVPDLIVRFRQDLGLLEACESPTVGRIRVPVGSRWARRSGDHSPRSAVWATGPAFPAGSTLGRGNLLDVAPTILASLDCPLPAWLDGRPLEAARRGP